MKASSRILLVLASAALAGGLSWAIPHWPSILVPEAPVYAWLALAAVAWGFFFLVLAPFWLPAIVPVRSTSTLRVVSAACAGLLFLVAIAAGVLQAMAGAFSLLLASIAVIAMCAGLFHWRSGFGKAANHVV